MKNKYTPGPLGISRFKEGDFSVDAFDGGDSIASGIKKEADAVLFHAAPDMLEALKETVSYLKSGDLLEGERYLLYKVEAAIKKAQPHE